ncbi:uncharacterized protein FOMMEDRAFT_151047 [Fomitiporia mediterranea MF3/22]|uniref:uncharacterized protein n=1 Tax=Fomitiporia mediterranea (strain MF3/22) TaxID=694068 RepID=UPI000440924A|nr:uncharacterized protein FOMMEDRAFT_151047 [Fomitiporia mediterranea MF3/22]EJD08290.1 hypothetical protein FOMMEDRAFT_151047 [Fomitiporia mediterranea MF3/22]
MPMADDANNNDAAEEEQAGHHVKLHKYCSTDVDNMVQRHIHSPQSIYPSSLTTVLLLLPSAPGHTSHLHCVSLHSLCKLPWFLTTPARVCSHFPLLSPPQSVRSARSLSPYPYITHPFDGERESKHPADFGKQPDNGAHNDDDDDDEGPRPSGSGGASSGRQPSGSMGGNAGMSGRSGGSMSMTGRGAPGIGGMGSGGRVAGGMNMGLDFAPSYLLIISQSLLASAFLPSHSTPGLSHLSAPSFPSHTQHPSLSAHLDSPAIASFVLIVAHNLPQTKRPRLGSSASSGGGTYPGGPSAYTIDDPGAHAAYLRNQNQNQGHAQSGTSRSQFDLLIRLSTPSPSPTGGGGNNTRSFYGQQTHGQASPPLSNASSTPSNANSNLFSGLLGTGGGGSPTVTSPHHSHPPRGRSGTELDSEWPVHSSSQTQTPPLLGQ